MIRTEPNIVVSTGSSKTNRNELGAVNSLVNYQKTNIQQNRILGKSIVCLDINDLLRVPTKHNYMYINKYYMML